MTGRWPRIYVHELATFPKIRASIGGVAYGGLIERPWKTILPTSRPTLE